MIITDHACGRMHKADKRSGVGPICLARVSDGGRWREIPADRAKFRRGDVVGWRKYENMQKSTELYQVDVDSAFYEGGRMFHS